MQKTKINGLILICCSLLTFNTAIVQAQTNNVIEDFKPSEVNQPGKQSPMVNSQGCGQGSGCCTRDQNGAVRYWWGKVLPKKRTTMVFGQGSLPLRPKGFLIIS